MIAKELSKPNVLIVEDEPSIADNIRFALQLEGFTYDWVTLGNRALTLLKQESEIFDIVILDIGLPDTNGLEICKQIRRFSTIPIIFLSARGSEIDRVVGLEIGADDYLTKPFSPRELVARIKLRIKSSTSILSSGFAPYLCINSEKQQLLFFNKQVELTLYEFGIITTLMASPGRVFSRDQLMESVWHTPEETYDRAVDTHIKTIRAKLKSINATVSPIVTHRGFGYSIKVQG